MEYASVNNAAQIYVASTVTESSGLFIVHIGFDGIFIVDWLDVGDAYCGLAIPVLFLLFKPFFIGLAEHIVFKSTR